MSLDFPNQMRSFYPTKNRICFWGFDEIMEVTFFIEASAIQKLNPLIDNSQNGLLEAFDVLIDQIHAAAHDVYKRRKKGSYVFFLGVADF